MNCSIKQPWEVQAFSGSSHLPPAELLGATAKTFKITHAAAGDRGKPSRVLSKPFPSSRANSLNSRQPQGS